MRVEQGDQQFRAFDVSVVTQAGQRHRCGPAWARDLRTE
jgi:hypothetical protein